MNAYEASKRIAVLNTYEEALEKAIAVYSRFNEEMGEGDPTARTLRLLQHDVQREREERVSGLVALCTKE